MQWLGHNYHVVTPGQAKPELDWCSYHCKQLCALRHGQPPSHAQPIRTLQPTGDMDASGSTRCISAVKWHTGGTPQAGLRPRNTTASPSDAEAGPASSRGDKAPPLDPPAVVVSEVRGVREVGPGRPWIVMPSTSVAKSTSHRAFVVACVKAKPPSMQWSVPGREGEASQPDVWAEGRRERAVGGRKWDDGNACLCGRQIRDMAGSVLL